MRVNFLDVDKAVLLGVLGETSVYLNSRYLPNLGYYPFAASDDEGYVKCYDINMDTVTLYGNVEIYIPNDTSMFPGTKRLLK